MRSFKTVAVAALVALALGLIAFAGPSAEAKEKHPHVRKLLHRTHVVLVHAHHAVAKGGEAKDTYRNAWIHQKAARHQLRKDHPKLAASLSLKARALARKAIQENKGEVKGDEATDEAEETKAAEGAADAEVAEAVKEAEKDAPTIEVIIKVEPKEED